MWFNFAYRYCIAAIHSFTLNEGTQPVGVDEGEPTTFGSGNLKDNLATWHRIHQSA